MGNKYCFWLNTPSPHQLPTIESFSEICDGEVYVITTLQLRKERIKQGLNQSIPTNVNFINLESISSRERLEKLIQCVNAKHYFTGINSYKLLYPWFKKAYHYNPLSISIFMEPYDNLGWKRYFRHLKYRFLATKYSNIKQVLTTSNPELYLKCGFKNVNSFGYFVKPVIPSVDYFKTELSQYDPISLCYVGRISKNKGIDKLLVALSQGNYNRPWNLQLFGAIVDDDIRDLSSNLGIGDRVIFHGVVPNDFVKHKLCEYDAFVFPTKYDGWGVAVAEAAIAGLPVYVSDNAGISHYIEQYNFSNVFNVEHIDLVLNEIINKGKLSYDVRQENINESIVLTSHYGAKLLYRYIGE
ncbi:glycosyltransferase [Vibrio fluvialis]|nr:glycosyltransferase [Vibrio fluvialis]